VETNVCGTKFGSSTELVLYECEPAMKSHKELFSLRDECYVLFNGDINDIVHRAAQEGLTRLHMVTGWETLLRISLWTSRGPSMVDVFGLLKKSGVSAAELTPFTTADINDLFPWLYYGKRFEILRKICNAAKGRIELKIDSKKLLVYSHLISGESERIVASSL
jgi:hypothetical protein